MKDSKIEYLATDKYKPNENCEWTVNDGKVAFSFASMDMEILSLNW